MLLNCDFSGCINSMVDDYNVFFNWLLLSVPIFLIHVYTYKPLYIIIISDAILFIHSTAI